MNSQFQKQQRQGSRKEQRQQAQKEPEYDRFQQQRNNMYSSSEESNRYHQSNAQFPQQNAQFQRFTKSQYLESSNFPYWQQSPSSQYNQSYNQYYSNQDVYFDSSWKQERQNQYYDKYFSTNKIGNLARQGQGDGFTKYDINQKKPIFYPQKSSSQQDYSFDFQGLRGEGIGSTQNKYFIDSQGQSNIGRYGANYRCLPKKKKIKKQNNQPPPLPKTKKPSLIQEANNQIMNIANLGEIEYVLCPFNSEHMMPVQRLLTHIAKCKESREAQHYKMCRYNPCHYYRKEEIQAHQMVCGNRYNYTLSEDWDDIGRKKEQESNLQTKSESNVPIKMKKNSAKLNSEKMEFQNFLIQQF